MSQFIYKEEDGKGGLKIFINPSEATKYKSLEEHTEEKEEEEKEREEEPTKTE